LHGGGAFDVQAWVNKVPALLHAWFPGQYGGQALAEILFGEVNPSGKLPITMEKRIQDNPAFATFPLNDLNAPEIHKEAAAGLGLFVGYRGYEKNRIKPQYPFGYGLSYTKFGYSDIEVDPTVLKKNILRKDDALFESASVSEIRESSPERRSRNSTWHLSIRPWSDHSRSSRASRRFILSLANPRR
jgi:Glycosyl hydrolase family 3 C-terminal domain